MLQVIKKDKNNTIYILLFFLFLPVIQLGLSYYISVSVIVFLLFFIVSFYNGFSKEIFYFLLLGFLLFFFKIVDLSFSIYTLRDILIPFREFVCFSAFFIISYFFRNSTNLSLIQKLIFIFLCSVFILVCFQKFYFSKGIYFGFPSEFFVMNRGTVEDADLALYHGTRYRPISFYGEPSYTAWVVLSLLIVVLIREEFSKKYKILCSIIVLSVILISEAFSGLLAYIVIVFFNFIGNNNFNFRKLFLSIFSCILLLFIFVLVSDEFSNRISNILESDDSSFNLRLIYPLQIINSMFINNDFFFGVNNLDSLRIDNAALGLFISYGIMSLFILFLILRFTKKTILVLYILLSLNFNGTFFRFDKSLILAFVVGVSFAPKRILFSESDNFIYV